MALCAHIKCHFYSQNRHSCKFIGRLKVRLFLFDALFFSLLAPFLLAAHIVETSRTSMSPTAELFICCMRMVEIEYVRKPEGKTHAQHISIMYKKNTKKKKMQIFYKVLWPMYNVNPLNPHQLNAFLTGLEFSRTSHVNFVFVCIAYTLRNTYFKSKMKQQQKINTTTHSHSHTRTYWNA